MSLGIDEYDRCEQGALSRLSNTAICAFGPVTFSQSHYPFQVAEGAELIRYVDVMHENKNARYFTPAHVYTADEAELIAAVGDKVVAMTQTYYGQGIRPWMAPLAAVQLFRAINALSSTAGLARASVFEIGPGSGYLGAYLIETGHLYASMDNAQAFYLWQSRLYDCLAQADFGELATIGRDSWTSLDLGRRVNHLPWWIYATLGHQCPIKADIVVCDHALGELSKHALKYILRLSQRMLAGSPLGAFVFTSPGKLHISNLHELYWEFQQAGFVPLLCRDLFVMTPSEAPLGRLAVGFDDIAVLDDTPMGRFRRKARRLGKRLNRLPASAAHPLAGEVPGYNPSGRGGVLLAHDFLPVRATESPRDYDFLGFIGVTTPLNSQPGTRP